MFSILAEYRRGNNRFKGSCKIGNFQSYKKMAVMGREAAARTGMTDVKEKLGRTGARKSTGLSVGDAR